MESASLETSPALGDPALAGGLDWVVSTGPFQFQLFSDAARRILERKTWAVRKPQIVPNYTRGLSAGQAEDVKGRSKAKDREKHGRGEGQKPSSPGGGTSRQREAAAAARS